jgi:hydroxymethylpyrimidine pyrophosphatase-like HAD family hydrolase
MTIKLLATDLDGTLLRGGQPVSAGNIAAAQAAAKAGTIVTIATGRMYRAAMPVAEALGLDVPIITYNGALIKSTSGKIYYEQYLDEDICRRITDFAAARGWYLQTYSGDNLYYSDYGEFSKRYENSQKVVGEDIGYAGMREKVSQMYKMLIITPDPAVTQDWMAELKAHLNTLAVAKVSTKNQSDTKYKAVLAVWAEFEFDRDEYSISGQIANKFEIENIDIHTNIFATIVDEFKNETKCIANVIASGDRIKVNAYVDNLCKTST